jgi:hypothetical protein
MHDQLAEKFAELFAECAATGDTSELRKEAAAHNLVKEAEGIADVLTNPLLMAPLGGATIGGVTGYYGTKKDKNKKRNAAIGALTGGLGGLSGAIAFGGKPVDGGAKDGDWTTNALKTPRYLADALGITGGAVAGGKFFGGIADKYFPSHAGELTRLAKQPGVLASAVGKVTKGKAPTNPYAKPLQQLFERYERAGVRVENLMPAGSSSDAIARAKSILDTKSLGSGPRSARTLIQMLEGVVDGKTLEKLFPNVRHTAAGGPVRSTGTLHSDLAKVQRRTPGRVARGAGGLVGGTAGGLLTDWLVNLLQNRGAQAAGGAPTLDNK